MLYKPPLDSKKGDNGKLLFIGGSKTYSGAAILALKSAVKFSDIVLFYPAEYDEFLINAVKSNVPEVIVIEDFRKAVEKVDAILFGSGAGKALINFDLLKDSGKKLIIDGDGLRLIKAPLSRNILLTPNIKEYHYLLNTYEANSITSLASSLRCLILRKGYKNILTDGIRREEITGGNAGLTKAGTGDILAGAIASLSTKNSLWDASLYGLKSILKASEILFRQKSYYYSSSELIDFLGYSFSKC